MSQTLRAEKSEKILEAARKVFARKGMAATMADVAEEAGVSQGLAYRYFPSKDAIVATLLRQTIQSRDKLNLMVREILGTPGERLGHIISSMVDNRRKRPEYSQMMYQGMIDDGLNQELRDAITEQGRVVSEIVRRLVVEAQATGEVAGDAPDKLVTAIFACLDGLSRKVMTLRPDEVGEIMPDGGIILRMLRPDSSRAKRR
ncbi:MAG: TetR/AcrR family transcriptional regulator [Thaumarchaeota archaeon]|nr:TetR/AcrR family transcriptional regulator [Nitrososphaerota archaeon]